MYCYVAYGLGIRSALPLPELTVGDTAAEVELRLGTIGRERLEFDAEGDGFWASADEACRYLASVGAVLVRRGREIVVDPDPGVDERVLRLSILGPAFSLLLHQRDLFVLHASAVESGGGAVAFTGGSGWGKSTLAAALHARGCGLVSDDLTAVAVSAACSTVLPGFPQFKLWPEAVVSLGEAPEAMPQLHPLFEKRACRVVRGFCNEPLPLRRVYLLAEGPGPRIESLRPDEAMMGLMPHWYGFRFGDRLLRADGAAAAHFRRCATLADTVAVRRLTRPRRLQAIHDLASLVEHDLAHGADGVVGGAPAPQPDGVATSPVRG